MSTQEQKDRYTTALHKLQTIIKLRLGGQSDHVGSSQSYIPRENSECSPKHLRVGVESALGSCEGLAELLVAKGIVTADEVAEATVRAVEIRAEAAEQRVRSELNLPPAVNFG